MYSIPQCKVGGCVGGWTYITILWVWLSVGTQEDVDMAVGVAKKAFESWSKLPGHVRARHMYSIARHVQKHARYVDSVLQNKAYYV